MGRGRKKKPTNQDGLANDRNEAERTEETLPPGTEGNEDEESPSEEEEESEPEKVDKLGFLDLIRNRSSQEGRSPERALAGLKSKALRSLRLRVSERIAVETISETRAVRSSVTAAVESYAFQSTRNYKEALVMARIIDLAVDQFNDEHLQQLDFLEIAARRLISIMNADANKNWDLAEDIEESMNPLFGPETLIRTAARGNFAKGRIFDHKDV
eukprot:Awhi_evm1s9427